MAPNVARALLEIELHPDYRVLKRFQPRHAYGIVSEPKIGLFVDCETNGLDPDADKIIQFAAARFEFDAEGNIGHVGPTYSGLEDPGAPLPPEIVELTGITDAQLQGQRIDNTKVAAIQEDVVLTIAHNAEFDRKMCERRFGGFDRIAWGCSQRDVKWERFGSRGAKLDYLLMTLCGQFHDAHGALADCLAGIEVLASPRAGGRSPFQMLLEAVREPTMRVFAHDSPFSTKGILARRHYRWRPDPVKCWARDVKASEVEAERAWLQERVYGPGRIDHSNVKKVSRYDIYSVRA